MQLGGIKFDKVLWKKSSVGSAFSAPNFVSPQLKGDDIETHMHINIYKTSLIAIGDFDI